MDADSSRCKQKFNNVSNDVCVTSMIGCKGFFAMPCSCALVNVASQITK